MPINIPRCAPKSLGRAHLWLMRTPLYDAAGGSGRWLQVKDNYEE